MGCLNSNEFIWEHWFGNIHLSGPCNRSCYFCIGQHMMDLDDRNNLDKFPLLNLNRFVYLCGIYGVSEIFVTGSNTDPMLYKHTEKLKECIKTGIPSAIFGIRTNGALVLTNPEVWRLYDKASISITSFNKDIYQKTMGQGETPELLKIMSISPNMNLKINIVLCPEILESGDLMNTLKILNSYGIKRVNLREPYGQAHIGDPLSDYMKPTKVIFDTSPVYTVGDMEVTYWDVHYVGVESINLYASGNISKDYAITKGHSTGNGKVLDQTNFDGHKRRNEQWLKPKQIIR